MLVLMAAALAHQVALGIWRFIPAPQQDTSEAPAPVARNATADKAGADFQQQANAIGKAFLFGKVEAETAEVEVEEAPETQLGYKLRGIYFSPDERLTSAIVEVEGNKSQHYRINDEFAEQITLAEIEKDYILINRFGKIERLNLLQRAPPAGFALTGAGIGVSSPKHTQILRRYQRRYSSNPVALATRFQSIPVEQDGKNIGFKLKALRGESLLKKLGLEANDVFTSINGASLKDPFEALGALKSLAAAKSVSVTFIRDGIEQTQDFDL